jgi:pimeloyl-ACP methyl ester carboxylesterase
MILEFQTRRIQTEQLTFTILELGEGPLVLALHGFPDLPRTFRYQMQALAAAGYHVVAPYMPGYYPTTFTKHGRYESAAIALDCLALLDMLTERPVILIGHDWGAAAAYRMALAAPEKIARLITIAVPYGGALSKAFLTNPLQQRRSWYMFFFMQMSFAEDAVAYNNFDFLERLWRDWSPDWQYPPEELEAVKECFRQPGVLAAAINYYRHTFNPSDDDPDLAIIYERYGGPILVPSLYLHGANDGGIGVEVTEGMEEQFPRGLEKHIMSGAGHFVHQEKAEEVNRLILSFLGR